MGFNIYEETVSQTGPRRKSAVGSTAETAEQLFLQHCSMGVVLPGTPFHNLCKSLAQAYPELRGLTAAALEGRAWEFFDSAHQGTVSLQMFLDGMEDLLKPEESGDQSEHARTLLNRLARRVSGNNLQAATMKVAVIGAGVAGLQVANMLRQTGKDVVIFEKMQDIGGVWRDNYADFGLQVPRELYEFPGFSWPGDKEWEKFPPGPQVQEYIQRYAKEFDLYKCIRFETAVLEVIQLEEGWTVRFQKKGSGPEKQDFDYLVVATGMYGWPPHIPIAAGVDKFKGEVLHSCTFTDRKKAAGKRVVVVGGGKSAVDNAVAAAKEGVSSTLVCRDPHWPVPRHLLNLVPFKWGTYSRFGHSTLPTYHDTPACSWWLHSLFTPLKWVWWRVVEGMFRCQFCLPSDQVPKGRIEHDLFTGGQILTYEFKQMHRKGQVGYVHGSISHFTPEGVVLMDGKELPCDMVVYGTGFTKSYDIFDSTFVQPMLKIENDGLWLYRNIIPPAVPNLAFIGSEVSTFNNILTHGLQALWLTRHLNGIMDLPGRGKMERTIEQEMAWKRSWMPPCSARASIWQLHMMAYHDGLLKDVGENHKRKGLNKLGEVFAPYCAHDYKSLFDFLKKPSEST